MLQVALSRSFAEDFAKHKDRFSPILRAYLEAGMACPPERYQAALEQARQCRAIVDSLFDGWDAFLTPSTTGEAPRGIETTGSPIFQVMWTLLNTPIATIPGLKGPTGLPVGVQFVGRRGDDRKILELAGWFHRRRSRI
jgi:Asp-tRNA(Asn)/Glu-tRNA(Gln) amidotransferase A subunit family amidase